MLETHPGASMSANTSENAPSLNVFVTGGSGFLGRHLLPALQDAGHRVHALARSDASAALVEGLGATPVRGSLGELPAAALSGIDLVIHAAAKAEDWGPLADFVRVNVEGTAQLLAAAKAAGVPRFVHISTEAVHFTGEDLVQIDEDAPLRPDSPFPYAATKAQAEQLVRAAEGIETVVLRPRLIWGPGDTTVLPVLQKAAREGSFAWVDGGRQRISTTHVHNLTDAILVAMGDAPAGAVLFITDAETHTARAFLGRYAAAAGTPLPDRSLPSWLLRAGASLLSGVWRLLSLQGAPPVTPFAAAMLSAEVTIRSDRAETLLGWRAPVDFESGIASVAA